MDRFRAPEIEKSKITDKEFYWLIGLLEGEGCFMAHRGYYPYLAIQMTDVDIIQRASRILKKRATRVSKINKSRHHRSPTKALYSVRVNGECAADWMKIIYSQMGNRRKRKIREILSAWHLFNIGRSERSARAKLRPKEVLEIRRLYGTRKVSQRKLAKMFRVGHSTIYYIVNRLTWKYI